MQGQSTLAFRVKSVMTLVCMYIKPTSNIGVVRVSACVISQRVVYVLVNKAISVLNQITGT